MICSRKLGALGGLGGENPDASHLRINGGGLCDYSQMMMVPDEVTG
jgi:hypothetical protein